MTTPGLDALAEAMRFEQASIYGNKQREHRSCDELAHVLVDTHGVVIDLSEHRARRSA